jgi:hypothetical protein
MSLTRFEHCVNQASSGVGAHDELDPQYQSLLLNHVVSLQVSMFRLLASIGHRIGMDAVRLYTMSAVQVHGTICTVIAVPEAVKP